MPEPTRDPELTELEAALRGLQPRADLDRAALCFRAGLASAHSGWVWPLAAVTSAATAAVLGFLLLTRPVPPAVERIVVVTVPVPTPIPPDVSQPAPVPPSPPTDAGTPLAAAVPETTEWGLSSEGQRLREHILRWGLDGLPQPQEAASSTPSETPASLLRIH
jgi:hypothetical protein